MGHSKGQKTVSFIIARKKKKGVTYWLKETSQTNPQHAMCGPHCLDPVSEKPTGKEIFMSQSGKIECQLFDDN